MFLISIYVCKIFISEKFTVQRTNLARNYSLLRTRITRRDSPNILCKLTKKKPAQEGAREMKSPRKVNDFLRVHFKMIDKVNVRQKPPSYVCSLLLYPHAYRLLRLQATGLSKLRKAKTQNPVTFIGHYKTSGGDAEITEHKTAIALMARWSGMRNFGEFPFSSRTKPWPFVIMGKTTRNFGNSEMHI